MNPYLVCNTTIANLVTTDIGIDDKLSTVETFYFFIFFFYFTFQDSDNNESVKTPVGSQRSKKRENGSDQNSDSEDPFPAKNFCQSAAGDLSDDVTVEERAQDVALRSLVPVERTILKVLQV